MIDATTRYRITLLVRYFVDELEGLGITAPEALAVIKALAESFEKGVIYDTDDPSSLPPK